LQIESLGEIKNFILNHLCSTYKQEGDYYGWGISANQRLSPTNTCEALLAYEALDEINNNFLQQEKDKIRVFLHDSLTKCLPNEDVRIRDLAYSALALYLLGDDEQLADATSKLISISSKLGGWPGTSKEIDSHLVPTFIAMNTLLKLGKKIENKHCIWLNKLQRPSNMCVFHPDDLEPNAPASSLVLYLYANSAMKNTEPAKLLSRALIAELNKMFSLVSDINQLWEKYDNHSRFTIRGYGHAMLALVALEIDFMELNVHNFLKAYNSICEQKKENLNIPLILELVLALRALRLNFDPFKHFKLSKEQATQIVLSELSSDRALIEDEKKQLLKHHVLIDEWEKDLIRQRFEIPKQVVFLVTQTMKKGIRKLIFFSIYYFVLSVVLAAPICIIINKIISRSFSVENLLLLLISLAPVLIELFRWKKKSLKEISNQTPDINSK